MSQFQSYFIISIYFLLSYNALSVYVKRPSVDGKGSKDENQKGKYLPTDFLRYGNSEAENLSKDSAHIFTVSTQFISETEATTNGIHPRIVTHAQP